MFILIILSYGILSFLDLKTTYQKRDKTKLIVYFTLMIISCTIGIANGYVRETLSPATPIKQLIFTIIGK